MHRIQKKPDDKLTMMDIARMFDFDYSILVRNRHKLPKPTPDISHFDKWSRKDVEKWGRDNGFQVKNKNV